MSSSIDEHVITLTRGDTFRAKVTIYLDDQEEQEYRPVPGDQVRFALKHKTLTEGGKEYTDVDPLINKQIPIDTMVLELVPDDTKNLGFGTYNYDIEITFEDGTVDTFITAAPFKLTKEVH